MAGMTEIVAVVDVAETIAMTVEARPRNASEARA
jgi:hypothetical protein